MTIDELVREVLVPALDEEDIDGFGVSHVPEADNPFYVTISRRHLRICVYTKTIDNAAERISDIGEAIFEGWYQ